MLPVDDIVVAGIHEVVDSSKTHDAAGIDFVVVADSDRVPQLVKGDFEEGESSGAGSVAVVPCFGRVHDRQRRAGNPERSTGSAHCAVDGQVTDNHGRAKVIGLQEGHAEQIAVERKDLADPCICSSLIVVNSSVPSGNAP